MSGAKPPVACEHAFCAKYPHLAATRHELEADNLGSIDELRQRLATAEADAERNAMGTAATLDEALGRELAALADAAALRERVRNARMEESHAKCALNEARERVTRAEALLVRWLASYGNQMQSHTDVADRALLYRPFGLIANNTRAFLSPTEPDGASWNRQGDDK